LDVDDLCYLLSRKLMEDHNIVDPIKKLRFEVRTQLLQDSFAYYLFILVSFLYLPGAKV
jgi:hypothetical protein